MTILDILKLGPVMPVIVIDSADQAEPLADALLAGGIRTAEITLRTSAAIKAIEKMARNCQDITVGLGQFAQLVMRKSLLMQAAGLWSAQGQHHLFSKVAKAPDCRFCQGRQAYLK